MRLLVDTSAYAAFFRGHRVIIEELAHAERLFMNPVAIGELLAGFRKGTLQAENLARLEWFLASPRISVLPIERETADRYAMIHDTLRRAGIPVPSNDLWIAATAFQHGLRVVTTDRHFERIPQIVTSRHAP
jgi:tRNA(fMet)-specific endonuclease VapC